jgi:nitrite reductase/ring-hydroxylating ferredoxin subunit
MTQHEVEDVCAPAEGELVAVDVDGARIALTAVDGELHAFDAVCPHAGCSLLDGDVEGATVTCPCRFARFDVTTGAVLGGPTRSGLRTWSARLDGGTLALDGPRPPAAARRPTTRPPAPRWTVT